MTLVHSRFVPNAEPDIYTTVVNVSRTQIKAIAFGVAHTDKFGIIWTPYKTDLTSEGAIKPGHSQPMHWQVLLSESRHSAGAKPGQTEMFVVKVAYSDGHIAHIGDFDGRDFKF